jgi:hypothetical protein
VIRFGSSIPLVSTTRGGTLQPWCSLICKQSAANRTVVQEYENFFTHIPTFFSTVAEVEEIRKQLSPDTMVDLDELGVILPGDPEGGPIPSLYWNACAALFAFSFQNLSSQNISLVGMSQYMGYPTQYPSVSMLNWRNGQGTARYWLLRLFISLFDDRTPITLVPTQVSDDTKIAAQAYATAEGDQYVVVLNKLSVPVDVQVPPLLANVQIAYVDQRTGSGPYAFTTAHSQHFQLLPFGVYVFLLKGGPVAVKLLE